MSLDTLLEAAKYLDKIEQNGDVRSNVNVINATADGMRGGSGTGPDQAHSAENSNMGLTASGHLRLDPNLPISFQFHTYSSPALSRPAILSGSGCNSVGYFPFGTQSTNSKKNSVLLPSAGAAPGSGNTQTMVISPGFTAGRPPGSTGSGSSGGGRGRSRGGSDGERDSLASTRHRELHKTLEKNRRAHLRHCFEQLKHELPKSEYSDKKTSHINIIHCAIRYIQFLKRTEWEHEHEMERLARNKIRFQNQLVQLKEDLLHEAAEKCSPIDIEAVLREAAEMAAGGGNTGLALGLERGLGPPSSAKTQIMLGIKSSDGVDLEDHSEDGDVIVELEAGEDYDDETTTTASECADSDVRDVSSGSGAFSLTSSSILNQCHA